MSGTENGPLRLAIVRQRYTAAGGAERFVSRALQALRGVSSLEVTLIARKWEPVEGIAFRRVDPFHLGNVWRDWGFARAARKAFLQDGFDLVQSHERIPGCDIYRAGDGLHARWLDLRRQTMGPLGRLALWLNPYHHYVCRAERAMFLHPRLKRVICNSRMVREEIRQAFGLPDALFEVIYNGVDTTQFHPGLRDRFRAQERQRLGIPADAAVLLQVGSGFERKGVARSLEAVAAVPDLHLVVVGHDKHAVRYHRMADRLGLAGRVHFAGAQKDPLPFYGMADAFILPTLYDPFPNVCVEALACGLPVLTSTGCGAAELLENGRNGWVADACDRAAWRDIVVAWMSARDRWAEMREAAVSTVSEMDLTSMAAHMASVYQGVCAGLGGHAGNKESLHD